MSEKSKKKKARRKQSGGKKEIRNETEKEVKPKIETKKCFSKNS